MTQTWPVLGVAPVPIRVSSYWSPLGVFCIFDSPFFSSPDASNAARASAAIAPSRTIVVFLITRFLSYCPIETLQSIRIRTQRGSAVPSRGDLPVAGLEEARRQGPGASLRRRL